MNINPDFIVSICEVFEMKSLAYVGADLEVAEGLPKLIPGLEGPRPDGKSDIVFLDRCYAEHPKDVIIAGMEMTAPGGFLMGTNYAHDEESLPVQAALADIFNLMMLQVGPGQVWAIRKPE